MKLSEFQTIMAEMNRHAQIGCSDGGCVINKNKGGQHTNGGCHCTKRYFRQQIKDLFDALNETNISRWDQE